MKCSFCGSTEYQKIFENENISDKKICDRCARLCKKLTKAHTYNKIISFPVVNTIA